MGLPKKRSRRIVVDETTYRYVVTGNDDNIDLIIEREEPQGQRLTVSFGYHSNVNKNGFLVQRNQITPVVVKRTIQYALNTGWIPDQKAKELRMNLMDAEIQLNLLVEE